MLTLLMSLVLVLALSLMPNAFIFPLSNKNDEYKLNLKLDEIINKKIEMNEPLTITKIIRYNFMYLKSVSIILNEPFYYDEISYLYYHDLIIKKFNKKLKMYKANNYVDKESYYKILIEIQIFRNMTLKEINLL